MKDGKQNKNNKRQKNRRFSLFAGSGRMKASEFIEKNYDVIREALYDYIRWFDEGEDKRNEVQRAIDDLEDVR